MLIEVSHLYHFPSVWPWLSYKATPYLSLPICKEELIKHKAHSSAWLIITVQLTVAFSYSHENDRST